MNVENPDAAVRTSARRGASVLATRNLMTVAALAVVGSLIVVPLTYLGAGLLATPGAALAACAVMGGWVVPYLLPAVIVRAPGAALLAGAIIGVITAISHPLGPSAILSSVIGAAFIEIPLAVQRYRWRARSYAIAAAVFGLLNGSVYAFVIGAGLSPAGRIGCLAAAVASALAGAAAAVALGRLVARAGVGAADAR